MFLDNKYSKWYFNIVKKGTNRTLDCYTENHHIIPKSLGGNDKKGNMVKLTAKEHYVVHLLLMKMCKDKKDKQKMCAAYLYMSKVRNDYTQQRYSSKLYEYHKKIRAKILSEQMSGSGNPMFNKKHTEETKNKIGKKNSRKTLTEDGRRRKSEYSKNNNPMSNPLYAEKARINHSKIYEVIDPSGFIIVVKNLAEFCRNNNLHKGNMCSVSKGNLQHYKKWKCRLLTT